MEERSNIRALRTPATPSTPVMPSTPDMPIIPAVPSNPPTVIPAEVVGRRTRRSIGVFAVGPDGVRFQPAVDVRTLTLAAAGVATVFAVAGAAAAARRSRPAVGAVTMGPGGWVSFKGVSAPALRPGTRPRPWWARLLRAHRLIVEP
jgi:hypothetical protein